MNKKKEQDLQLNESLGSIINFYKNFKILSETSNEIFWILDPDSSKLIYVSPAFRKIWGYDPSELYNNNLLWTEQIHKEDRKRVSDAFLKFIKTKKGKFNEIYRIFNKEKKLIWIHAEGSLSERYEGKEFIVGTARDITSEKIALSLKEDQELLLDLIVENIPDMVFVKDAINLKFVKFNRAGEKLLGLKRENLIGKSDYDFFPKKQADFFIEKDRLVLKRGKLLDIPAEPIKTPKGERILHTKKVPIFNKAGKPIYLLGISEDITDKKKSK